MTDDSPSSTTATCPVFFLGHHEELESEKEMSSLLNPGKERMSKSVFVFILVRHLRTRSLCRPGPRIYVIKQPRENGHGEKLAQSKEEQSFRVPHN